MIFFSLLRRLLWSGNQLEMSSNVPPARLRLILSVGSIIVGIVEKFFVRGASINSVPFLDIIQIIVFLFARNVTKSSRKSNRYSARDYARVTDFRTRREGCSRFSVGEDGHTKNYRQRARDCCSCQGNGCQHAIMRTSSLNESMQKAAR